MLKIRRWILVGIFLQISQLVHAQDIKNLIFINPAYSFNSLVFTSLDKITQEKYSELRDVYDALMLAVMVAPNEEAKNFVIEAAQEIEDSDTNDLTRLRRQLESVVAKLKLAVSFARIRTAQSSSKETPLIEHLVKTALFPDSFHNVRVMIPKEWGIGFPEFYERMAILLADPRSALYDEDIKKVAIAALGSGDQEAVHFLLDSPRMKLPVAENEEEIQSLKEWRERLLDQMSHFNNSPLGMQVNLKFTHPEDEESFYDPNFEFDREFDLITEIEVEGLDPAGLLSSFQVLDAPSDTEAMATTVHGWNWVRYNRPAFQTSILFGHFSRYLKSYDFKLTNSAAVGVDFMKDFFQKRIGLGIRALDHAKIKDQVANNFDSFLVEMKKAHTEQMSRLDEIIGRQNLDVANRQKAIAEFLEEVKKTGLYSDDELKALVRLEDGSLSLQESMRKHREARVKFYTDRRIKVEGLKNEALQKIDQAIDLELSSQRISDLESHIALLNERSDRNPDLRNTLKDEIAAKESEIADLKNKVQAYRREIVQNGTKYFNRQLVAIEQQISDLSSGKSIKSQRSIKKLKNQQRWFKTALVMRERELLRFGSYGQLRDDWTKAIRLRDTATSIGSHYLYRLDHGDFSGEGKPSKRWRRPAMVWLDETVYREIHGSTEGFRRVVFTKKPIVLQRLMKAEKIVAAMNWGVFAYTAGQLYLQYERAEEETMEQLVLAEYLPHVVEAGLYAVAWNPLGSIAWCYDFLFVLGYNTLTANTQLPAAPSFRDLISSAQKKWILYGYEKNNTTPFRKIYESHAALVFKEGGNENFNVDDLSKALNAYGSDGDYLALVSKRQETAENVRNHAQDLILLLYRLHENLGPYVNLEFGHYIQNLEERLYGMTYDRKTKEWQYQGQFGEALDLFFRVAKLEPGGRENAQLKIRNETEPESIDLRNYEIESEPAPASFNR